MNLTITFFSTLLEIVGYLLFTLHLWLLIAAYLGWRIWQTTRQKESVQESEYTMLLIEVPKNNDKKELSAEQMFASLHGILTSEKELAKEGRLQDHISFEIASVNKLIQFYVRVPIHLKDFVEGQIYAQYPNVHIKEGVGDYSAVDLGERQIYGTELVPTKSDVYPIRTFVSFEVDPLAGITAVLAKLDQVGEETWIQILARPLPDTWQAKSQAKISELKNGKKPPSPFSLMNIFYQTISFPFMFLQAIIEPPGGDKSKEKKEDKKDKGSGESTVAKAIEEKSTKLGYAVKIRVAYIGSDPAIAKSRIQALAGAFKQFNTTNLNGFANTPTHTGPDFLRDYQARLFADPGYIFNIEELASVYHLPHGSVETPSIVWSRIKTGEPPANLPVEGGEDDSDISFFGVSNFRHQHTRFGIKRRDRGRHLYIIGQTGTGKSFLSQVLTLSDIYHNEGFAIIDPHGDFAADMLKFIPPERLDDVVYFNPVDRDFPMAFNPLEVSDPIYKNSIASEMVGVLKRMFEAVSWGPRLEYILRYTILALLDYPDSTMLGITRMLTDKGFRKKVIAEIQDPVVRAFWVNEFASWNEKFASEAVAPVLNKVGAFTANPLVRNLIGQPKSTINLRQIMDEGKILIVNLSRGQIGEDNAAILGALMVTKIQLAAMSRADMPLDQRRPFYLYVDEFQNFATDSFATILSEARKYGLNLTIAHQYIGQMNDVVKEAVFGNVGSMISFRVGADDATFLTKYFEPTFEASDLLGLNNQNILVTMSIDGEKSIPFSARTMTFPKPTNDLTPQIVESSRRRYAKPKAEVEAAINTWSESGLESEQNPNTPNDSGRASQPYSQPSSRMPEIAPRGLNRPQPRPESDRRDHRPRTQPAGRR